jgi:hypothetical protein
MPEWVENVSFDPDTYKLSLFFEGKRLTFQAIDNQNYSSMKIVLERCVKEKPDFVLLPIFPSLKIFKA